MNFRDSLVMYTPFSPDLCDSLNDLTHRYAEEAAVAAVACYEDGVNFKDSLQDVKNKYDALLADVIKEYARRVDEATEAINECVCAECTQHMGCPFEG